MTQNQLEQIKPITKELTDLKKRAERERIVSKDGISGYTLEGWQMFARINDLDSQLKLSMSWIDSIDDSKMRQIFRYRYIDSMTWQKIAYKIGEYDESYPRRQHKRLFGGDT